MRRFAYTQKFCAVLLVLSSIALASYQVFKIDNINDGTLMYIAQAFLLVGSIFGLDYYVNRLTIKNDSVITKSKD